MGVANHDWSDLFCRGRVFSCGNDLSVRQSDQNDFDLGSVLFVSLSTSRSVVSSLSGGRVRPQSKWSADSTIKVYVYCF